MNSNLKLILGQKIKNIELLGKYSFTESENRYLLK